MCIFRAIVEKYLKNGRRTYCRVEPRGDGRITVQSERVVCGNPLISSDLAGFGVKIGRRFRHQEEASRRRKMMQKLY